MPGITWLASYPKSGNTWLRIFFSNLRRDDVAPLNINELDQLFVGVAGRELVDQILGLETVDLTHGEIDWLRPDVYRYLAENAEEEPFFCKIHDAFCFRCDGEPVIPADATAGVIYLIRNPLDVCVSYAHHYGNGCEEIVALMANPHATLASGRHPEQLRQRLLTWSGHVMSWVDSCKLRTLVLRYEDMIAQPMTTFMAAAAFVGMTQDRARVSRALGFSSIEELQRQERIRGFTESLSTERPFFRKGKVGGWREELTQAQATKIITAHRKVMLRFGYLTEAGEPVF